MRSISVPVRDHFDFGWLAVGLREQVDLFQKSRNNFRMTCYPFFGVEFVDCIPIGSNGHCRESSIGKLPGVCPVVNVRDERVVLSILYALLRGDNSTLPLFINGVLCHCPISEAPAEGVSGVVDRVKVHNSGGSYGRELLACAFEVYAVVTPVVFSADVA